MSKNNKYTSIRMTKELKYKIEQEAINRSDSMELIIKRMYLHWMRSKKVKTDDRND